MVWSSAGLWENNKIEGKLAENCEIKVGTASQCPEPESQEREGRSHKRTQVVKAKAMSVLTNERKRCARRRVTNHQPVERRLRSITGSGGGGKAQSTSVNEVKLTATSNAVSVNVM